jgi:uncharacterized protein (DUF58 family)
LDGAQPVQIILDASASMGSGDGSKEQRTRELAIALLRLCARAGRPATLWASRGSERNRVIDAGESDRVAHLPFDGTSSLPQSWPGDLAGPSALRVVLSDYLFPDDPERLLERATTGAAKLFLIQLLDPWETEPKPTGRTIFLDVETEESLELSLGPSIIDRYKRRLATLQQHYASCCAAAGATWISVATGDELEKICRDQLVPVELLCEIVPSS